jgi:hypothetical protein
VDAEIWFKMLPDGTLLLPGDYISDQFEPFYGLTFSATGPGALGEFPRLLDCANPSTEVDGTSCGDRDLGAPNEKCPGGGPGEGKGGEPGPKGDNPYKNCQPQGNVLIIQEDNEDNECAGIPDDNQDGGEITLNFSPMAEVVYTIGLMDIDYATSIVVVYVDENGKTREKRPISIPLRGDNSLQTVYLNEPNVVQLRLKLERSGAITMLTFCYNPDDDARKTRDLKKISDKKLRAGS